jgi:hypothetical protein
VTIPGGKFLMGSPATEKGRQPDEGPQHSVVIEPFYMGKYEVTWDLYDLFAFTNMEKEMAAKYTQTDANLTKTDATTRPSPPYVDMSFGMGREGYPAINMTQYAAIKFCAWLYAKTGVFIACQPKPNGNTPAVPIQECYVGLFIRKRCEKTGRIRCLYMAIVVAAIRKLELKAKLLWAV